MNLINFYTVKLYVVCNAKTRNFKKNMNIVFYLRNVVQVTHKHENYLFGLAALPVGVTGL